MLDAWELATKEERHEILTIMLDAVYVDLGMKSVVAIQVKPSFKPLFTAWLEAGAGDRRKPLLKIGNEKFVHGGPDRIRTGDLWLDRPVC